MNQKKTKLLEQIHSLIYPKYPCGTSAQLFIQSHQNLYEVLSKFDTENDPISNQLPHPKQSLTDDEQLFNQNLVNEIIYRLTQSCTYCHRRQFYQKLNQKISHFKGSLKNLKIGQNSIKMSYWQNILDMGQNNNTQETSLIICMSICDQLYQFYNRVPHQQTLLLKNPQIVRAKYKFTKIMHSSESHIPIDHQYYLAIIASATYGCRYLWNRNVSNFLKVGGDITWITEGISAAPPHLQDISRYSSLIAYNSSDLFEQSIFTGNRRSSSGVDNEYKLQAFIILSYYQSLSCLNLVCGVIPQSRLYEKYLPSIPYTKPSLETFETINQSEQISNFYEIKKANQFTNMYSWEDNQQEYIQKIKKISSRSFSRNNKTFNGNAQKNKKIQSLQTLIQEDSIYLLGKVEEDQIKQKIKNLDQIQYLKQVFQKYVNFQPISTCFTKKESTQEEHKQIQDQFILASEWDFKIKGLNKIQSSLGAKYRQNLQNFISSLRNLDGQKNKKLKSYYEFFNNYMYEYISYSKLVKQLTTTEKNYLKLVTKSPFLFNEQTFGRMKKDLAPLGINVIEFILEAISYKLQLNINLITYIFKKQSEQDYYQYE